VLHSVRPLLLAAVLSAACSPGRREAARPLDAARAAAITDSVRAFAQAVARDVSARGPEAWRSYFVESPAFFMASEGRMVFPSGEAATQGIEELTHLIKRIQLRWGDTLRVDPLYPGMAILATAWAETTVDAAGRSVEESGFFTGLAEHCPDGWRFRDAHWSVAAPARRAH
jgi:hypothetical protein